MVLFGIAVLAATGPGVWAAWPRGSTLGHSGGSIGGTVEHSGGGAARLRGIDDVGSSGGVTWVVNGKGIWLTSDAGRTWRRSVPPDLAERGVAPGLISDVQFVDRQHGWMSVMLDADPSSLAKGGHHFEIDRTTDGGRTWHWSLPPGCSATCGSATIDFLDARHGYALAWWVAVRDRRSGVKLFRTDDGGRSWQFVSRPSVGGQIAFLDDREGFVVATQALPGLLGIPEPAFLSHTTDGGRTWSRYRIPPHSHWLQVPFARFGRRLVVAGLASHHVNGPNGFYVSDDGGEHWSLRAPPRHLRLLTSFSAGSPRMWALSSVRVLYVTRDAGRTWRKIDLRGLPESVELQKIVFSSSRVGWALLGPRGPGWRGSLIRTTDGGRHWTPAGPRLPRHTATRG
jgi:photosystem II stability/assembly factor-like uncharacterized protein